MHQCSPGNLLALAALVHHDDNCHLLATCRPYRVKLKVKFSSTSDIHSCMTTHDFQYIMLPNSANLGLLNQLCGVGGSLSGISVNTRAVTTSLATVIIRAIFKV